MNEIKTISEHLTHGDIYSPPPLLPIDLQGWNGDSHIFSRLIEDTDPKVIIEVGTWKGQSAINMAGHLKRTARDAKIYCVDTWLGALEFWHGLNNTPERDLMQSMGYPQVYYKFLSNVVHYRVEDYIIPVPMTSAIAARYFAREGIRADLIYIDGSHDYEDVLQDIISYKQLLTAKGTIFGDDYNDWADVRTAVNKCDREGTINLVEVTDGFWIAK